MKFIDRKGKLLGIINVFDLFVLLILTLSIFFAYKWVRMAEDPSWVNVTLSHMRCIAVTGAPPYIADLVKEGDEAYNDDGLVVAKVEKVLSNEPSSVTVYSSKDGEKLFFESDTRNVTVQLELLSYEKKGDIYAVASGPGVSIRPGLGIALKTKKYANPFIVRKILNNGV
ncbi:MAG: DUF4330 family protein [Candidatus Omnitrophota bacterium]